MKAGQRAAGDSLAVAAQLDIVGRLERAHLESRVAAARGMVEGGSGFILSAFPSCGGVVTFWWVVVRGNLDHEVHHRGQVAAWLRAAGITASP